MSVQLGNKTAYFRGDLNLSNQAQAKRIKHAVSFRSSDKDEVVVSKPAGEKLSVLPNLVKGFIQPIKDIFKAIIEAPLPSIIILGATATAMRCSKLFGSLLTLGIFGYGAFKVGSGTIQTGKAIKAEKAKDAADRDYAKANKQIQQIGEGTFDIALTAKAAYESLLSLRNTATAIKAAKQATTGQKVYAVIKQTEVPKIIETHPKTALEMWQAFKADSVKEILKLKNLITGSRSGEVPEAVKKASEAIAGAEPNKAEVVSALQDAAKMFKNDSKTKKAIDIFLQQLGKENITKMTAAEVQQAHRLLEAFETLDEVPASVKVLRSAMRTGNKLDDVAKMVTSRVSRVRSTTEAAISNSELLDDER